MMVEVDVVDEEVFGLIRRMEATLSERHMALSYSAKLRRAFREQIDESFASEGQSGGGPWAPLSEWRVDTRGDEGHPILRFSGSLHAETRAWKGTLRLVADGFSFWFPDTREMTGRMWGLYSGQLINPLGATPLAATPRPVLGSQSRVTRDTVDRLVAYFAEEGWLVEIV